MWACRSIEHVRILGESLFAAESPLCVASDKVGQIDRAQLPSPEKLIKNVKHFLGYHMIKQFDVLNFLEDTGELVAEHELLCTSLMASGYVTIYKGTLPSQAPTLRAWKTQTTNQT